VLVRLCVQQFGAADIHTSKGAYIPALPFGRWASFSGPELSFLRAVNDPTPSVSYTLQPASGAVNPSMKSWERGTESTMSVSSTRAARKGKRNLSNCVDLSDVQHGRQALSARLCPRLCPSSERATSHALSNWRPPVMRQAAKREHSGLDPAHRARDKARDKTTPGQRVSKQTRCRTHPELLARRAQRS
jgi:hypothetical protein